MSYKVIVHFTDIQDCYYPYYVGDKFPRDGKEVSESRLKELSTNANKRGVPLIELVEDTEFVSKKETVVKQDTIAQEQTSSDVKYTKTEINRLSTKELKEVANKPGIDDAYSMTGSELKKVLIKKFRL